MNSLRIRSIVPLCLLIFVWHVAGCTTTQTHKTIDVKMKSTTNLISTPLKPLVIPSYKISESLEAPMSPNTRHRHRYNAVEPQKPPTD